MLLPLFPGFLAKASGLAREVAEDPTFAATEQPGTFKKVGQVAGHDPQRPEEDFEKKGGKPGGRWRRKHVWKRK